jgi:hypothetical protein
VPFPDIHAFVANTALTIPFCKSIVSAIPGYS